MKSLIRILSIVAASSLASKFALAQPAAPARASAPLPAASPTNAIVLPAGFKDPLEPFNRVMWSFNEGLLTSVASPVAKGYRFIVVKPVRTGIGHAGENLKYPVRLVNNLLQGNWAGTGDETARCVVNTVFGLGGFFDVATREGIPASDAEFGQTFRKWGWRPGCFLMLPIFGPSDVPDATGLAGDAAANPMTWFFPYNCVNPVVTANDFSDKTDGAVRFSETEADSYSILEYGWSFMHERQPVNWQVPGAKDEAALETLDAWFFKSKDAEFADRGHTRSVLIPATGKKLEFTSWLQPGTAPVVYIVPGFGAHRLDRNVLALAELVYDQGCSAVCISSIYHPEFMERAATTDLPGFPAIGVQDVHAALTEIDLGLTKAFPHRLGARALMGYSMGGFQTLFIAATAATNQAPLLKFDRFIAIDAPVRLRYCVNRVDELYDAPLAWPAAERTANIHNTLLKVAALVEHPPKPEAELPFNGIESRFLIGLSFRLTLRDCIFNSQLRHNQGILKLPLDKSRRRAAYDEIMGYKFWDYIQKFAMPYDKAVLGIDSSNPEVEAQGTNLRYYSSGLQGNPKVRIIANRNDLFLAPEDLNWLETTFAPDQTALFDRGGHLGNLSQPAVQQAIQDALAGLAK